MATSKGTKKGRPISAKRAAKKVSKGKGFISRPMGPKSSNNAGSVFLKTKPNKKGHQNPF